MKNTATIEMNKMALTLIKPDEMGRIICNENIVDINIQAKQYSYIIHWAYFMYVYAYAVKTGQPVETVLDSIK